MRSLFWKHGQARGHGHSQKETTNAYLFSLARFSLLVCSGWLFLFFTVTGALNKTSWFPLSFSSTMTWELQSSYFWIKTISVQNIESLKGNCPDKVRRNRYSASLLQSKALCRCPSAAGKAGGLSSAGWIQGDGGERRGDVNQAMRTLGLRLRVLLFINSASTSQENIFWCWLQTSSLRERPSLPACPRDNRRKTGTIGACAKHFNEHFHTILLYFPTSPWVNKHLVQLSR